MKKEKTIRTYQRKTKSGKITTVKSHTAKYDAAAEVAKKAARKKGAGGELQAKITKMPDPKLTPAISGRTEKEPFRSFFGYCQDYETCSEKEIEETCRWRNNRT